MNNYFHKIHKFDIDEKRLYDEFITVANKHDMFERTKKFIEDNNGMSVYKTYYRLRVNYPSNCASDMDPVVIQGYNSHDLNEESLIENIIDDFKGTYTAEIARSVNEYLCERYPIYKVVSIKYHVLAPNSSLTLHTDGTDVPRFFLSVSVPEGAYMQINDEKIPMHENGALYRLICRPLHNPLNESDGYRVSMVFTVEKK
jgi:hypothetical protein